MARLSVADELQGDRGPGLQDGNFVDDRWPEESAGDVGP